MFPLHPAPPAIAPPFRLLSQWHSADVCAMMYNRQLEVMHNNIASCTSEAVYSTAAAATEAAEAVALEASSMVPDDIKAVEEDEEAPDAVAVADVETVVSVVEAVAMDCQWVVSPTEVADDAADTMPMSIDLTGANEAVVKQEEMPMGSRPHGPDYFSESTSASSSPIDVVSSDETPVPTEMPSTSPSSALGSTDTNHNSSSSTETTATTTTATTLNSNCNNSNTTTHNILSFGALCRIAMIKAKMQRGGYTVQGNCEYELVTPHD